MKRIFSLMVLMLCFNTMAYSKDIYLIRHAEKANDGSKDPVLTNQGQQRAKNIAAMLSHVNIKHVYATNYLRTQLTAKPMADFLGVDVKSYNPRQLPDFAEKLQQLDGNALVVGHSNTTPMLTHLLSDRPVFSLDEADFDNVFHVSLNGDKKKLSLLKSTPSRATESLTTWQPMHDQFFNGELTFNMLFKNEVVGQSKHVFRQQGESYHLHEHTQIESMDINADIEVEVNAITLSPKKLKMSGTMGVPVEIQLDWQVNQVKGFTQMAREPFKAQGKLAVDQVLRDKTIERTSAIMLAHLMPVDADNSLLVNWFNGYDADNRLIDISYHGEEQITVPAGTFDTYKIKYSGGAPSQYYWIDKQHAKVVKIEVLYMPWSYELYDFKLD